MPLAGMNPGAMDGRITIQEVTETRDAYGGVTEVWSTLKTVWADRTDASTGSDEQYEGAINLGTLRTIFTIRHLAGVNEKNRILDGTDIYDIKFIERLGRNNYMKITTELRK